MQEKIVVDLDHPVWLSEPGFGNEGTIKAPYCILGKMRVASGLDELTSGLYTTLIEAGIDTKKYWSLNDLEDDKGYWCNENHWKAVRTLLEDLAANPNVELKGTMISDVIKEKVNV